MDFITAMANGVLGSHVGSVSNAEAQELLKALSTGYDIGGTSQTGAGAFRAENLDDSLASLTEIQEEIVFSKMLSTRKVFSTVTEFAQRTALAANHGGWLQEGELPEERDGSYARKAAFIKYLGTVKSATMAAEMTRGVTNAMEESAYEGMMWVARKWEQTLFKGNSKLGLSGAEFEEIDGLETYISRDAHAISGQHIVNLWGSPLEEGNIRNAAQVTRNYHGFSNALVIPSLALEDYDRSYRSNSQLQILEASKSGKITVGHDIGAIKTSTGTLNVSPIHLYGGLTREQPLATASTRAPSPAPTVAIALQATGTGLWANSLNLVNAADSGTVAYRVCVGNRYGEATFVASAPATLAVPFANRTNSVRVTITNPAGGYVNAPTYASIYRQDIAQGGSATGFYCVGRVAMTSQAAAAAGLVWDDNGDAMPGTYRAFVGRMDPSVIRVDELLPFSRIDLPLQALAKRAAFVKFCTLVVRNPFHWVMITNIGTRSS